MVYDNVKRIADSKGMTIRALESEAGLPNGIIGKWRHSSPMLVNLEKVAKALDVSIETLIRKEEK